VVANVQLVGIIQPSFNFLISFHILITIEKEAAERRKKKRVKKLYIHFKNFQVSALL